MDSICKGCGLVKPIGQFASAGIIKGIQYYRSKCVKCYSLQKSKERRILASKFEEYKKTLKCLHCGTVDFRVLEFHHKDPSIKDTEISIMVQHKRSWQSIMHEVRKCLCLCANCHRIVHYDLNS